MNVGFVLLSGSVVLCLLNLLMVSSRFLHTLICLEQLNALILLASLLVSNGSFVYFVSLLVVFTLEAVVSLVVLTRVWSGFGLFGLSLW